MSSTTTTFTYYFQTYRNHFLKFVLQIISILQNCAIFSNAKYFLYFDCDFLLITFFANLFTKINTNENIKFEASKERKKKNFPLQSFVQ